MKNFNLSLAFVLAILMGVLIQSCKSSMNTKTAEALEGAWVLTSLNGENAPDVFKGKIPVLNIDFNSKRVYGNGGCNSFMGGFTFEGGVFTAPNLVSTMMACMDDNKEMDFHTMMAKQNTVSIEKDVLTFKTGSIVNATFVRGFDTALMEGEWTLKSMPGENIEALFPTGRIPTISFNKAEGRVSGNAGCNRYNSTYTLTGSAITINVIAATRMTCPNIEGENRFIQNLSNVTNVELSNGVLSLLNGNVTTLVFEKK